MFAHLSLLCPFMYSLSPRRWALDWSSPSLYSLFISALFACHCGQGTFSVTLILNYWCPTWDPCSFSFTKKVALPRTGWNPLCLFANSILNSHLNLNVATYLYHPTAFLSHYRGHWWTFKKFGSSIHPGRTLLAMSPPGNITLMEEIYSEWPSN